MTTSRERSQQSDRTTLPFAEDRPTVPESRRDSQQTAGEQAKRPGIENLKNKLWTRVDHLVEHFGEADIGGPWRPEENAGLHTTAVLESSGGLQLKDRLEDRSLSDQIQVLLYLWKKCWDLADVSLAYRTLQVVQQATAKFVYRDTAVGTGQPQQGWQRDALCAVGQAMRLTTADMAVFKQINLSSADGFKVAANNAIETAELAMEEVRSPLAALGPRSGKSGDDSDRIAEGLREIENLACKNQIFYLALAHAADALIEFEEWLAMARRVGSAQPPPGPAPPGSHPTREELLASVDAAIGHFRHALASLRELIACASVRELIARDSQESLKDLGELVSQNSLRDLRELIAQSSLRALIADGSLGELIAHGSLRELIAGAVAEDQVLSRCEPWERLLIEVRDIVFSGDTRRVFVPRRVSIRHCYPFAIEASEDTRKLLDHEKKEELFNKLRRKLNKAFKEMRIKVGEVGPLVPTEFFTQGSELYGGVRVDLPEIKFRFELPPGVNSDERGGHCQVWIVLSYMGNHCLCIEPKPLDAPLPHLLYRALHVGTPVALGARVFLAEPPGGKQVGWDSLQSFSRDVIRAVADMPFWGPKEKVPAKDWFVRGNLHEIVVVRTDDPLGLHPEAIADALDQVVGGRILVRSVQRTAMTLEEWVRYPPVPRTGSRGLAPVIVGISEMGLAGDWCTDTGETTVFGIVAAPSWHSDVYVEAAQFANSWSPRLRLWNRRLEGTIQSLHLESVQEEGAKELRHIERQVRLHLGQIKTEELTATLAHRRFLDQLLEMAGLSRLQGELEAQLEAVEILTDWFNQQAYQKNDRKRQVLLGLIALFGLFELASFLSLIDVTKFRRRFLFFTIQQGAWEDWLMLALIVVAVPVGFYFFNDGVQSWVNAVVRKLRRKKSDKGSRKAMPS
jgi:hypothetical protein